MLLAATALGAMALAGGISWLVVSRGLYPLAQVAQKIRGMDETGLKARLAAGGVPQEIEPVVRQLNGLLERLDAAFDRERALTADVAHELRSPVAEIRTIAEIALNRLREPEEYREALGDALNAAQVLQGLIEKLLVLARVEAGQVTPELRRVALKPILMQQWEQVRSSADVRGVKFEDRCSPEAVVRADATLLEVILANILSNAPSYTPDGGQISVGTRLIRGCPPGATSPAPDGSWDTH